jgi:glycosyltransferase involved in cell wall biosynthesis
VSGPRAGEAVTPVVLTHDEERNLGRTLESLRWASRVLVVDSGSRDGTERIARSFRNVAWTTHPFESPGDQWRFAISHEAVETPYVLALDADMAALPEFVDEVERAFLPGAFAGGSTAFRYAVGGRPLLGSLYPRDVRVLRRDRTTVLQRGHTHVFVPDGPVYRFRARLLHDDRKPFERWARSQVGYAAREAARIRRGEGLRLRDRVRLAGLAPLPMFWLAWLRAGGPLRGRAALRYARERSTFEALLARALAEPPAEDEGA